MKVWQSFAFQVIASKYSLHSERLWDKRVPPAQLSVFSNSYLFSLIVLKASPVANVHTVAMWTLFHLANWRIGVHLQFRLLSFSLKTILYLLSLNFVSLLLSTVSPWASNVLHWQCLFSIHIFFSHMFLTSIPVIYSEFFSSVPQPTTSS